MWHASHGEEKRRSCYPLVAHYYAGFHETEDNNSYELSQQFLAGLRASLLRFLAFIVLVLRT